MERLSRRHPYARANPGTPRNKSESHPPEDIMQSPADLIREGAAQAGEECAHDHLDPELELDQLVTILSDTLRQAFDEAGARIAA